MILIIYIKILIIKKLKKVLKNLYLFIKWPIDNIYK